MTELLSWEEIADKAVPKRTAVCGIYFLLQGNRIVYVGQSRNIHVRIVRHMSGKKIFNRYHFVECPKALLDRLEAHYIATFRPKYNIDTTVRRALFSDTVYRSETE